MELKDILYTKEDGIATITLNRPQALNAVTPRMHQEWTEAIGDAKLDPQVKVLIVTGAGRVFCAGGNLRLMVPKDLDPNSPTGAASLTERRNYLRQTAQLVSRALSDFDKPYIGAINGAAAGGGMDMASLCDIRIASEQARFSMAYIRMGMTPVNGGCYLLPRIIGIARACELIWTGRTIDAEEALRIGYVSRVVPHDELMPATRELALQLAKGPSVAIQLSKRLIYHCLNLDFLSAIEAHEWTMKLADHTEDAKEGPRAWAEKREPQFKGR